jgi:hypothetical protein
LAQNVTGLSKEDEVLYKDGMKTMNDGTTPNISIQNTMLPKTMAINLKTTPIK